MASIQYRASIPKFIAIFSLTLVSCMPCIHCVHITIIKLSETYNKKQHSLLHGEICIYEIGVMSQCILLAGRSVLFYNS